VTLDLIVIGAGPAGVAAACEASRLGASFAIVDARGEAGGTIRFAHEARNVPFLEDRVAGELVASHLRLKARALGRIEHARIASVALLDGAMIARAHDARVFEARCVVVATGTRPVVPLIPGLPGTLEPPWAEAAQAVEGGTGSAAVIGGSDVAFDQARALQRRGIQTTILCRGPAPRAPGWLCDEALRDGVELLCEAQVESAARCDRGVRLELRVRGKEQSREVGWIVPATGRVACVPEGVESLPRLRARVVGDAAGRRARHVAIAMGEGCLAAFELLQGEMER